MYLCAHTHFSLKYGILSPTDFVELCIAYGFKKTVVTDINNTSAILETVKITQKSLAIEVIPGVDFRNGNNQKFVAIAKNNDGYLEINDFLSAHLFQKKDFPDQAPDFKNVFVIYPFKNNVPFKLKPNEFIGIDQFDLPQLTWKKNQTDLSKSVAFHQATLRNKRDFNTHRLLRAIDKNLLLSKLPKSEESNIKNTFFTKDQFEDTYTLFPELLKASDQLLSQCSFHLEFYTPKNLSSFNESPKKDFEHLRELCEAGIPYRYDTVTPEIRNRIEKELDIINQKGFNTYFLINWDMLKYARSKGYYYVGRGSGANSIIAYILRITDVDPIELDLYFERFINLYRENPPDFDIDFSWKDRDDIHRYLFNKYEHIALLATYNTFQYRGVIRELGKVFGMPKHEIDRLTKGKHQILEKDSLAHLVTKYGKLIHGKPNHLGIHAGGVLISQYPLHQFSATHLPPKGLPTVQFDMIVAEDIGLYKFDILSQRGLAKIRDAVESIRKNRPNEKLIDLQKVDLLKKDPKTLSLLKKGEAMGCFYVESPAMRMLFKKLKVRDYLGLVAASSIIRPGVSSSGMMVEYIKRYNDPKALESVSPIMLSIMPETYGIMVYQEDVIKVAHHYAKLTLTESDVLRRGMSGKFRGYEEFLRVKEKYFSNCKKQQYPQKEYIDVWRQIESFAGYAFSKGHSASYAIESFQALYLKAHYPIEYMVATINNGGGFYRVETYLNELKKNGGKIEPPCINQSQRLTINKGTQVILGFNLINSLSNETIELILEERANNGSFKSLEEFMSRLYISFDDLSILINVDTFRYTGSTSRALLLEAHLRIKAEQYSSVNRPMLFPRSHSFKLPSLASTLHERAFDQLEYLGYTLSSPFDFLEDKNIRDDLKVRNLPLHLGNHITIYGYLVTAKRTTTTAGSHMGFGTFLTHNDEYLDTIHFPEIYQRYPFQGIGIYKLDGFIREEYGYYTLEVSSMIREVYLPDPRFSA